MDASTSGASELRAVPHPLIALLGLMPDAALLVAGSGEILAANARARTVLRLDDSRALDLHTAVDVSLAGLTVDPDATRAFLRLCARSPQALPGALTLRGTENAGSSPYAAAGALVAPRTETSASIIAVRFWPRDVGNPFILLTQKVAELNER
ncbi:MAG: hypothetical protein M3Y87_04495 [Myxococcota bacterium]|nr:hypothetical protein [Myxococcota bacterium]